jgi:adenine phosphoribosyltransferase
MFLIIKALFELSGSHHYLQASAPAITRDELHLRGKTIINSLRTFRNWPKEGVNFKDISPTVRDPELLTEITELFAEQLKSVGDFQYLVCLESRGFLYGTALAIKLGKGIILARKPNKLPGEVISYAFKKEYGEDIFEI